MTKIKQYDKVASEPALALKFKKFDTCNKYDFLFSLMSEFLHMINSSKKGLATASHEIYLTVVPSFLQNKICFQLY